MKYDYNGVAIPETYEEQIALEQLAREAIKESVRQNGKPANVADIGTAPSAKTRPSSPSPLGAVSRADALERVAATKIEWRIEGVMSLVDYGTLAGPKGVGKSLALADMAVSVALGEPWLGRFPTKHASVLLLTCEDHEALVWQRLDAIARSKEHDPGELEGLVYVHPFPFSAIREVDRFRAELEARAPGLVLLDPAYKYLAGANTRALFDMGEVLTPLQTACWEAGAAFLVGHHYNRREGAAREERITGAGILEWARVVITMEAGARRAGGGDAVEVVLEVTGNSLEPAALRARRTVWAMEEGPAPELGYSLEVVAEGAEATRHLTAADRVRGVLGYGAEAGLTIAEMSDRIGPVIDGKHLRHDTIRQALNRDLDEEVDNDQVIGAARTWWLIEV